MYQLLLNAPQTSQSTQNAIDALVALFATMFTSLAAMLGGVLIVSILIPIIFIIGMILVMISLGLLTSSIAGKKGYNKIGFFWYGFFFFPIAVGVAILAQPINGSSSVKAKTSQQDEDQLAKYKEMYEAGTLSWTQYCQKKEEFERKAYYK